MATMKNSLLIVENDALLRGVLSQALSDRYSCSFAQNLKQAYGLIDTKRFDLMLLDRVLDDGDGIELLPYIRECCFSTRVLMISMLDGWSQKVAGLTTGADDYLAKPFALPELTIRLEHLLATQRLTSSDELHASNLSLHLSEGFANAGDQKIPLRRKEAQILACLLTNKNKTVSKHAISKFVWTGADQPEPQTLEVYIRRLRLKLGSASSSLVTVRGFGYRYQEPEEVLS